MLVNDISGHTDLTADIYLGSNTINTLVAGRCTTSIDLGFNNRISCGPTGHAAALYAPVARASGRAEQGLATEIRQEIIAHAKQRATH